MSFSKTSGFCDPWTEPSISAASVILAIPTLNEAAHIKRCISSLVDDDPFMSDVSIVVADGGSTDGTPDIVRQLSKKYPNMQLIRNPGRLQSAGINRAVARHAETDRSILIRCDAHSVYPPGFVRRLTETLQAQPEAASVAIVMDAIGTGCFQKACAWIADTPLGSGGSPHRGGVSSGWVDHAHHAAFRLNWFREIGGYDETFSHNEDAEYDYRLRRAGGHIWLDADIRLGYVVRSTPGALARQYWNYGRGRARTVKTHRMRLKLRQITPAANTLVLGASLLASIFWTPALIWPAMYLFILAGASLCAAMAMRSSCGLLAGVALGIMHNAWGTGFLAETARPAPQRGTVVLGSGFTINR